MGEERERTRAEILVAVDEAEASLARGEGRIITQQSMRDLAGEVKQRGRDRLRQSNPPPRNGASACTGGRSRTRRHLVYIAKESHSIEIADRVVDSITARFFLLATYPHVGRRRDEDLRPGLRSFPVGEYVIIYRLEGEDAPILHVIRGSREVEALFTH
ncbi:MAG TPA: type II toxin-antitoxin system RelE/ParE family toxin [Verrucomicrobiae bacterium]|nr:type II toxin-antitoxin system RelE/ParE family toxin [Verrucomicrobiae bacterium]